MKLNSTPESPIPLGTQRLSEAEGRFIQLQSTHLSAFLATCDHPPVNVRRGPEVTAYGAPVTKWIFHSNAALEDVAKRWAHPNENSRDWQHLTDEEKDIVINFVTAFSNNLRHFIADAKRGE